PGLLRAPAGSGREGQWNAAPEPASPKGLEGPVEIRQVLLAVDQATAGSEVEIASLGDPHLTEAPSEQPGAVGVDLQAEVPQQAHEVQDVAQQAPVRRHPPISTWASSWRRRSPRRAARSSPTFSRAPRGSSTRSRSTSS